MSSWKNIGTLLLEYGLITDKDLKEGLDYGKEEGLRLGEALVQLGKIGKEDIEWVLSKQLDVPFVIVENIITNMELLHKFQKEFLIDNRILPLYETDDQISIVMEDPFNASAIEFIEGLFHKTVDISTGSGSKIDEVLKGTFKKVGLPDLVESIRRTVVRIRGTSFYRLDFVLEENACRIAVFGCGVLREVETLAGWFTKEDVLRALDELAMAFLCEETEGEDGRFLAVYPLENEGIPTRLPAIIGHYGLCRPDDTAFSDTPAHGPCTVLPMSRPVEGYLYLAATRQPLPYPRMIYTLDAAPEGFTDFFVRANVPRPCPSCGGAGCPSCDDLGYTFEPIEGVYSSDELRATLTEATHGKD